LFYQFTTPNLQVRINQILSPGKFFPLLTLFDLIEQEKTLKRAMNHEEKQSKASEIIKTHVGYSLGAALVPFPGADLLAVSAVQLNMLRQLAKLYQVGFVDVLGKNIISAVVGSSAARLGASLVKAIPGVGTIIGELSMPVLSGASTWALGRVVANHFEQGGSLVDLDITRAKKTYESEVAEGKKVAESLTATEPSPTDATDAALDKLRKLAEMKDSGILTEEEFKQLKDRLLAQL
jgi:uncharacterized protein (DUF697 family)